MSSETAGDIVAALPEDTRLCSLVIPGTHDTMTSTCTHPYYRTQDLDLAEQLELGVRFLDLRLRRTMVAAHREWVSTITAESILRTLRMHLDEHPRDFVLVRIQNANEAKDDFEEYGRALLALIQDNRDLFWTPRQTPRGTVWPSLGDIRGKVVALECAPARYGLTTLGGEQWSAPWHGNPRILLQDDWNGPEESSKLSQIVSLHRHRGDEDCLVLNHVSATNGEPGTPAAYADRMNPAVLRVLGEGRGRGVLIFDFIDPSLINAAWRSNHPGPI